MNVLERTREYGLMRAMGTSPVSVFSLVIIEVIVMAVMTVIIACIVSYILNYSLSFVGIPMPLEIEYGGVLLKDASVLAGLGALWAWGPLGGIRNPEQLVALWQAARGDTLLPAWIVLTYVAATLMLVPLNLLLLATGAMMGPLAAAVLLAALAATVIGLYLLRRRLRRPLGGEGESS